MFLLDFLTMKFLEPDLPVIIQYSDELDRTYLVTKMDQIQWHREFNVIEKNVKVKEVESESTSIQSEFKEIDRSIVPLDNNHWIKREVEDYIIPATVLNEMGELTTSVDGLVNAIKRAIQWSTLHGSLNYVNPTAIVYNVVHQLTGLAMLPDIDNIDESEDAYHLALTESIEGVKLNRYLIDYVWPNGDNELQFSCYAPNAKLAILQLKNEIDPEVNVVNVSKLTSISFEGKEEIFAYSIVYRLRHESLIRYCYYHSNLLSTADVHNQFSNENTNSVVYQVTRIINDERF